VAGEGLERGVRVGRAHDLHQLDLVELVLADHPARVLAVGAGLRAKARRVCDIAQRQRLGRDDLVAHEIGDGDLGRGDEEELGIVAHREEVGLELRELAGAGERGARHEIGDVDLGIAVLAHVQVEHELRERAMQARERAVHHGEACARDAPGGLEVEPAARRAEGDVVLRLEVERARCSDASHLDVRGLVAPLGDGRMQQVRYSEQQRVHLTLHGRQLRVDACNVGCKRFAPRDERRDVLAATLGLADRLRVRVALGAQAVGFDLRGASPLVERAQRRHVEAETAAGEVLRHGLGIGAKELGIEHVGTPPQAPITRKPLALAATANAASCVASDSGLAVCSFQSSAVAR